MWVTYLEGYSALAALSLSGSTVSHYLESIIVQDLSVGTLLKVTGGKYDPTKTDIQIKVTRYSVCFSWENIFSNWITIQYSLNEL